MRCIWFSSCLGGKLKKMELLDWNLSPCHLFPAVSCVCVPSEIIKSGIAGGAAGWAGCTGASAGLLASCVCFVGDGWVQTEGKWQF